MNKCKIKVIIQERSICLHIRGQAGECFLFSFFFFDRCVAKAVFCTVSKKQTYSSMFFFFLQQGMQT